MQRPWTAPAVLVIALAALAGCGGESEKLVPVSGSITVDGKAVPNGTVTLYPESSKGNASQHQPTGVIDTEGRFEMYLPGGKKGVPPGWYKVVVYAVDNPQPGKPNKYWVNKKYTDRASTPLLVEAVENPEPGRYALKLDK